MRHPYTRIFLRLEPQRDAAPAPRRTLLACQRPALRLPRKGRCSQTGVSRGDDVHLRLQRRNVALGESGCVNDPDKALLV